MDKLKSQEERIWYAGKTIENGWSKTILELQIQSRRYGESALDPYLFDF